MANPTIPPIHPLTHPYVPTAIFGGPPQNLPKHQR